VLQVLGTLAYTLASMAFSGVSLATAVMLYVWLFRVRRNLIALNVAGLRFTPGWSVGWFFVPVMNWFRPWQVMKETVKASRVMPPGADPLAWKTAAGSPLVHWWWWLPFGLGAAAGGASLSYLVPLMIGYLSRGDMAGLSAALAPLSWYASIAAFPGTLASYILLIYLVRQVMALQEQKAAASGQVPDPRF
jgi:hypothetical protein